MIELVGVSKRYGEKRVLEDFSLRVEGGVATCVLGASGCGKTTLLHIASGLLAPDAGTVSGLAGARRSFVFQEDRLLPWMSALRNLTVVGVDERRAREMLEKVGLEAEMKSLPDALSGGMRRRLAIARALAYDGDCYFFDEPLQGLDEGTAERVMAVMREAIQGKTTILITHDEREAKALGDVFLHVRGLPLAVVAKDATPLG